MPTLNATLNTANSAFIYKTGAASWSTILASNATGVILLNTTSDRGLLTQYDSGPALYTEWHFLLEFDTSSIPTSVTINSVDFQAHIASKTDPDGVTLQVRSRDYGSSISTADWVSNTTESSSPLCATKALSTISTGSYFSFTENGTIFRSSINKGGVTRLVLTFENFVSGTAPTGSNFLQSIWTTANPFILSVTYTNTYNQSVSGAMGVMSGTLTKAFTRFGVNLTGILTASGDLIKNMAKFFTGSAGTVNGTIGTVSVKIVNLVGTMGFLSGTLAKQFTVYGMNLIGSIDLSGTLSSIGMFVKSLTGSVSTAGSVGIYSTVRNAIMKAGSVVKTFMRGGNA